jgi:hypothetical protein
MALRRGHGRHTPTLPHIAAGHSSKEATVFEHRTEAEMRLYSERTARELALKKQQEEDGENNDVIETPPGSDEVHATTAPIVTTDAESDE